MVVDVDRALAADLPSALGAFRRAMRRALGGGSQGGGGAPQRGAGGESLGGGGAPQRGAGGESLFGPLTGAQAELLRLVRHQPGVSVTAAAAELRLAANTVSTLVGQLSEAGLLLREPDPADRRVARLRLTDHARAEVRRWRDRQAQLVGTALARLPDGHLQALAAALPALAALTEQLSEEVPGD